MDQDGMEIKLVSTKKNEPSNNWMKKNRNEQDNSKRCKKTKDRPNIIYIAGENIGWNDVGFNNRDILTPNIDKLAAEGVILDNHYIQAADSPARAAFITGRYDFRTGYQEREVISSAPNGLPLEFSTIADKLKELGYSTHIVGKWRLGFCKIEFTPLERGFDSFYGFFTNEIHQFNKLRRYPDTGGLLGFDFRDNTGVIQDNNTYTEFLFRERLRRIVSSQNKGNPFFLYYATNIARRPQLLPEEYENLFTTIKEPNRRVVTAKMSLLDETVGLLIDELRDNNLLDNTLLVFSSMLTGDVPNGGNNYPLRGNAFTLYEGGTRAPTFVFGKMLKKNGYRNKELFHQVDWFNTFITIAGGKQDRNADSINQWRTIRDGKPSSRNEIIYTLNLDDPTAAAIRIANYKLITGNPEKVFPSRTRSTGRYPVPKDSEELESFDICGFSETCPSEPLDVLELYDLENDPFEEDNLVYKRPDIVKKLWQRLEELKPQVRDSILLPRVPELADPDNFGGVWSPGWC